MSDIVSCTDLRRVYGEGEAAVHALRGVTLSFPAGPFTAILGPTGSGKSTLMHLLAGLDKPTSGSVVVDGQEIASLNDAALTRLRRDRLGFVFQAFNLVPVLTAEENILLPLTLAGRKPDREWLDALISAVSASPSPARSCTARPWCSPTSRPSSSTRTPPTRCCGCSTTRSPSSARPS